MWGQVWIIIHSSLNWDNSTPRRIKDVGLQDDLGPGVWSDGVTVSGVPSLCMSRGVT